MLGQSVKTLAQKVCSEIKKPDSSHWHSFLNKVSKEYINTYKDISNYEIDQRARPNAHEQYILFLIDNFNLVLEDKNPNQLLKIFCDSLNRPTVSFAMELASDNHNIVSQELSKIVEDISLQHSSSKILEICISLNPCVKALNDQFSGQYDLISPFQNLKIKNPSVNLQRVNFNSINSYLNSINEKYDYIFIPRILHLIEDKISLLKNLNNMLNEDGVFIFSEVRKHLPNGMLNPLQVTASFIPGFIAGEGFLNPEDWIELVNLANFKLVETRPITHNDLEFGFVMSLKKGIQPGLK